MSRLSETISLLLLLGVYCGALCSMIAKKKKRNPTLWFIYGFFTGVLALIGAINLPEVKDSCEGRASRKL
jgi:hypothetical protein